MENEEKIAFKNRLKQFGQQIIEDRISAVQLAMQNAQEAANNEEKSSAGDKYETGRAMGHLQKDMHARQLSGYLKEKADLQAINTGILCRSAVAGAFLTTKDLSFFIAAGLGKQTVEGQSVFFISPYAPLAMQLQSLKRGEDFVFNKSRLRIIDLF